MHAFLILALLALAPISCTTVGSATIGKTLQEQSEAMAREIEESGMLVDSPELVAYVDGIGQRLAAASDSPPVEDFHFAVLDDEAPNAFAIPSGHIYISRGLLVLLGDDAELAGVLGHEIGHVLRQHSLKRATGQLGFAPIRLVTQLGGALVGLALPAVGDVVRAGGELPAALTGASYSRSQENEADTTGLNLATGVGWDPTALARVMAALSRYQSLHGGDPNRHSWFSTHPTSPDREERILNQAKKISVDVERAVESSRSDYYANIDGVVVGSSASNGVFSGAEFLHPGLEFALRFPDEDDWTVVNTPQAVAALRESPPAAVILQVVARGDDALAVAEAFEPKSGKLDGPPRAESVNGLPTAYATGSNSGGLGRPAIRGSARWIAHGGLIYRILSESTEEGYGRFEDQFTAVGRSFRPLSSADRRRIVEDRLHIDSAESGESLNALLERVGSEWPIEEAAAANAVAADVTFEAGELVKTTRRERYRSPN